MNKKYAYMQIGLASPEDIKSWSHGEVTKPETINYRTLKPEKDGLFCEVIFGPQKDYQCACGKTKRTTEKNKKCEKCGVELTESKVRRERMGHIALLTPVVHCWYVKNSPSKIAILLARKTKEIEDVVALSSCVITDPGKTTLHEGQIISLQEARMTEFNYGMHSIKFESGAEAIRTLLRQYTPEKLQEIDTELREQLKTATKQNKEKIIKRLEIVDAFLQSGQKPEWMVLENIPVLPPDLRPMVQLDGGRFATTDLNDLYRRIIYQNLRLKRELDQRSPDLLIRNEKRIIQESVDSLIDNGKKKKAAASNNRPLKSLSDILRGKQGRFRQNLLGKRVDYSGRSVIAVGPDLKMYQCGLPREMALILFKPFIIHELMKKNDAENGAKISIKTAKEMIESKDPAALEQLEKVVVEHPVLLNRAPTLHRLGIQAFEPKLVDGKAIRLHPLVCSAFNADFDGDQMAVHVPLSEEAQAESRLLMLASKNILAPKDGKPIVTPSQDMVLGNYYLTIEDVHDERNGRIFKNVEEVELAYENDQIGLHTRIFLPVKALDNTRFTEKQKTAYILTTYGKLIFNTMFPKHVLNVETGEEYEDIPYVNEAETKNLTTCTNDRFFIFPETFKENGVDDIQGWLGLWFDEIMQVEAQEKLEKVISDHEEIQEFLKTKPAYTEIYDFIKKFDKNVDKNDVRMAYDKKFLLPHPFKKGFLKTIITEVFKEYKLAETSKVLDKMKDLGFYWSTISGITVSIYDIENVSTKQAALAKADAKVAELEQYLELGFITPEEKRLQTQDIWNATKKGLETDIANEMKKHYIDNHIYLMGDSGARGSVENYVQLSGMRGLMGKPNGESMDIPIRASFREGLTMADFFNSSHGSRKGCTDTALKTAESGYLTRRLVDVSQEVVVREDDCGTDAGRYVREIKDNHGKSVDSLFDRINGRFTSKSVFDPKTGELIIGPNEFITDKIAHQIISAGIEEVCIRTLLTCKCKNGVCVKCYGSDLSTGDIVEKGEVVGVIAAQSIGEPGTQLTMRTFHTGGVAGGDDITQGLPRIQELFEARTPKNKALIAKSDGFVKSIKLEENHRFRISIQKSGPDDFDDSYLTDSGKTPIVTEGQPLKAGQKLTEGLISPKELLTYAGEEAVSDYILQEVQTVYGSQGVGISDKHVEIIIKQMLQKVYVEDPGDTELLPDTIVSKTELDSINKNYSILSGKKPAKTKPQLLGITRASLKSDSYLAAASFQETTRVLTEAAIRGKKDTLEGLKENIIIGGLIPAGTGLVEVSEESIVKNVPEQEDVPELIG